MFLGLIRPLGEKKSFLYLTYSCFYLATSIFVYKKILSQSPFISASIRSTLDFAELNNIYKFKEGGGKGVKRLSEQILFFWGCFIMQ